MQNIKFVLIGDGPGLSIVATNVKNNHLGGFVSLLGRVDNVNDLVSIFDIGIIPWIEDPVSSNILPTKLFEYMSSKVVVLAPNFGEFKRIIQNNYNGFLFSSFNEAVKYILFNRSHPQISKVISEHAYKQYKELYDPSLYVHKLLDAVRS
jgi:glycosyltransferase involved in cell wall biosynthesis